MITRILQPRLLALSSKFPVVTLTGPRQSGKTTLCRMAFPDKSYVSLEAPDVQEFARRDPRAFLAERRGGTILDEVHRVPELLSYIQPMVDDDPAPGRFILTGSANFALLQSIGQSLAGRTAVLELLPLSLAEVRLFDGSPSELLDVMWRGSAPAVFDRGLQPAEWYASYVATYVERDVRSVLNVGDLVTFQTFLRLCAGRVGNLVNLSSLGADAGIVHATVRAWLSVLEAGYVAWRLAPMHANFGKRLVKTPKLHFFDSGLVCWLLGIRSPDQLREHPLRGAVFETWVAAELRKWFVHRGMTPALSFFRDRKGSEVDLVVENGRQMVAIETKSGTTVAPDFFGGLDALASAAAAEKTPRAIRKVVVYGGEETQRRSDAAVLSWKDVAAEAWDSAGS